MLTWKVAIFFLKEHVSFFPGWVQDPLNNVSIWQPLLDWMLPTTKKKVKREACIWEFYPERLNSLCKRSIPWADHCDQRCYTRWKWRTPARRNWWFNKKKKQKKVKPCFIFQTMKRVKFLAHTFLWKLSLPLSVTRMQESIIALLIGSWHTSEAHVDMRNQFLQHGK